MSKLIITKSPFYFIRHGQTDWNLNHIIMGQNDISLNQTGIDQACKAEAIIKTLGIKQIISSPLLRARQTAEIINRELNLPISYQDGLKERNLGTLEGTIHTHRVINKLTDNNIENIEIVEDFHYRIANSLNEVLTKNDDLHLIVSHAGVFMSILELVWLKPFHIDNCSIYLFRPPLDDSHPWQVIPISDEDDVNFDI